MRSRRQPCGYTSRLTAQRGRDRGDRHLFGVRPLKTRCRGSTRGCKLRCRSPAGTGGASTQPHGDEGSDGAGGGHGTGEPGLGTDSGDRGTPLGAAPSRPATAARPYRDFLGVLFAVGGQHPSRGAPPCGLPQLVVTGRKAVFLRGGGNPEESPIPFLPTLPKAVPAPTSSAQRAVERLWILPECRITLSKRSATESRRQPLSPGAHTAGGAAARTSSHSSASAAPGPAESGGRRGPVEGSRWVPSLPLFPIPCPRPHLPAPPPWRGPYRCGSPCPAPLGAALPPVPYIGRVGCARRGRGAAGGLLPSHRAVPAAHRGLAPTAARPHGLPPAPQHTGAVGNGESRAPHG